MYRTNAGSPSYRYSGTVWRAQVPGPVGTRPGDPDGIIRVPIGSRVGFYFFKRRPVHFSDRHVATHIPCLAQLSAVTRPANSPDSLVQHLAYLFSVFFLFCSSFSGQTLFCSSSSGNSDLAGCHRNLIFKTAMHARCES